MGVKKRVDFSEMQECRQGGKRQERSFHVRKRMASEFLLWPLGETKQKIRSHLGKV